MTTIATGVIMRIGTYDIADYPDRTQREVHPSRRDESITYRIESDEMIHTDEDGWDHYAYKFAYRFLGKTLTVPFRAGTSYGKPKPQDGLMAAFWDAESVAYDDFGVEWIDNCGLDYETDYKKAERLYAACERMDTKLTRFLGEERATWTKVLDASEV